MRSSASPIRVLGFPWVGKCSNFVEFQRIEILDNHNSEILLLSEEDIVGKSEFLSIPTK